MESSRVAYHGKESDVRKYIRQLLESETPKTNNIDEQFEGVDFGK